MTGTPVGRGGGRAFWWLLGLVTVAVTLMRLVGLDADPSSLLETDFITDEGWWAQNARDRALFGRWVVGQHNPALVLCPAHTLALRATYSVFGVSFWSTRVVGAMASVLTVALVAWMLRRKPRTAILAASLVATQPILFSMSRVGFPESLQLLFVTLAVAAASDEKRRSVSWLIAGGAAALAVLTKASAMYAPLLVVVAPFLTGSPGELRRHMREAGLVVLGGIAMTLPFVAFEWQFIDLLRDELNREGTAVGIPPRGVYLLFYVGLTAAARAYHGFWPGLFAFLAVAGILASRALVTRSADPRTDAVSRLAVGWLVLSFVSVSVRGTPPLAERYWMNLLVPIACLMALACQARQPRPDPVGAIRGWSAAAALAVAPLLILRGGALVAIRTLNPGAVFPLRTLLIVLLPVTIALTAFVRFIGLPERLARRPVPWQGMGAAVALLGALFSTGVIMEARYTVRDASRALAIDGGRKVLVGDPANTLALETPYLAFVRRDLAAMKMGSGWLNEDWRAFGATHWLDYGPPDAPPPGPPVPGARLWTSYALRPEPSGRRGTTVYVFELPSPGT